MVNIIPSYLEYYLEYDSEGEQQKRTEEVEEVH